MGSDRKTVFTGTRFNVVEITQSVGNGQETYFRQVVQHPGAVVILPMVDEQHVCLIRNHRVAVGETLIELPAGTREPNEEPERTASRELQEETGYQARRLELLTTFYPSPGIMDEKMFLFAADGLTKGSPSREVGEEIENLVVPFTEALTMIEHGHIQDAKTIIGLLLWHEKRSPN